MAFNKDRAKSTLADGGLPFLPENLDGTKSLSPNKTDLIANKSYKLGRLGVVRETLKYKQPFAALELDDEFYTGYSTALSNQIVRLVEDEIGSGNTEGMVSNNRTTYAEQAAEIDVHFEKRTSDAGSYWLMLID